MMFSASASICFGGKVCAQAVSRLQIGAHVRVTVPDTTCRSRWRPCERVAVLRGTLVGATRDSLVIQLSPTTVVPIQWRAEHQVSVRERGSRARTAFWSALSFGFAVGVVVAQTDASTQSKAQTAGVAAGFGVMWGAVFPPPRWQRVVP
jgi:hypothetical protein